MRSLILALLFFAHFALAGFVSSSTSGNATATAVFNSNDQVWLTVQAFSNGPTIGQGSIDFFDTFSIIGPSSGFLSATVSGRKLGFDGYGLMSATVDSSNFSFNGGPPKYQTFEIPFIQYQPIEISAHVQGYAQDFAPNDPNVGAADITIVLIFSDFKVFDSSGVPIADFSYTTASGGALPFAAPLVAPEPSSWLLAASGLALLGLRNRRMRRLLALVRGAL